MKCKKTFYIVLLISILLTLCSCSTKAANTNINDKLIRFHVIANSDSAEDQNLKLKVRDDVLKAIGPKLENLKSKDESENVITQNIDNIKRIAQSEIIKNGKNYQVSVALTESSFPVKQYSSIALPAGDYEALKIVIGKGEGKNWWCVMFPPLCYVDITNGITSKETEERLKTVLNDDEYDSILQGSSEKIVEPVKKPLESKNNTDTANSKQKVEIKFKSVELAETILSKIEGMFNKNR